jgi:2-dehydro-3-deoxyglucarate aldolase/4-hydroxy-2-oxoheptanedioate aldolase
VLDIGADGVIVPMVNSAAEARRAVAACRYPPEGERGFGPRRPAQYGRLGGPEFCRQANAAIIVVVQIEHIEAVNNLDEILAVPGVTSILVGPNDLAGSMGLMGQPGHPRVMRVLEDVVARARAAGVVASVAIGAEPEEWPAWVARGVQWITYGGDLGLIVDSAAQTAAQVRQRLQAARA